MNNISNPPVQEWRTALAHHETLCEERAKAVELRFENIDLRFQEVNRRFDEMGKRMDRQDRLIHWLLAATLASPPFIIAAIKLF